MMLPHTNVANMTDQWATIQQYFPQRLPPLRPQVRGRNSIWSTPNYDEEDLRLCTSLFGVPGSKFSLELGRNSQRQVSLNITELESVFYSKDS
jgi:hypothetical protein